MKSINTFADHAPKIEWVKNFFEQGNEFLSDNTLGPMQISMFKRFLSDSDLIVKAKTTPFFELITKIGWESEGAWGLILIQLAYKNPQIRWYIDHMPIGEQFPRPYLQDKIVEEDTRIFGQFVRISVFCGSGWELCVHQRSEQLFIPCQGEGQRLLQ